MRKCKKAVYALSADPITNGHINIIERAVNIFGELVVAVGDNPQKRYVFDREERTALVKRALFPKFQDSVEVTSFNGLLVDYAYQNGTSTIIRGIRNSHDADFEHNMQDVNKSQKLGIEMCFLFAEQSLAHISSSAARELIKHSGDIIDYVPLCVKQALEEKIMDRRVFGLTGEIGAGKSYIGKVLKNSFPTLINIEVDQIGRDILTNKTDYRSHLVRKTLLSAIPELEKAVTDTDEIYFDLKILGSIIFNSKEALKKFNTATKDAIQFFLKKQINQSSGIVLVNSALLVESNLLPYCNNNIIQVTASDPTRIERLRKRGYPEHEIEKRVQAQLSSKVKREKVEEIISSTNFGNYWEIQNDDLSIEEICEKGREIFFGR